MERLMMHIILDIIYRLRAGQSVREIARDLGHSRDTVRKYRNLAEAKGYLNIEQELPDEEIVSGELPSSLPTPGNNVSTAEPYRDVVKSLLDQGVEMVAIHRRLMKNHG